MFYDTFLSLCSSKGIKPGRAADEIGINRGTVTSWKKRGYTPRADILQRIANYFDVSVNSLLDWNTPGTKITFEVPIEELQESVQYMLNGGTQGQKKPTPVFEDGLGGQEKAVDENILDEQLIQRLCSLTPEELGKVDAFVQGLIASR